MRLGRIPWINCFPVYGAIDRGLVPVDAEVVSATAADLNDLLAAGQLDVSVVSAVEYARSADDYLLLPDLAISADGLVMSVLLLSRRPFTELTGALVLRTSSSRTSVLLLELLCRHWWQVKPRFATVRAEPSDLPALAGIPHEAVLVIGDAALSLAAGRQYPYVADLSAEWKAWTGLPFVFAVWAARRAADVGAVRGVHRQLLESRAWGLAHLDLLAEAAAGQTALPVRVCREYLGELDYGLGDAHVAGLTAFFGRLATDGLVPRSALAFLDAA
jgi:chorismate dehydratase